MCTRGIQSHPFISSCEVRWPLSCECYKHYLISLSRIYCFIMCRMVKHPLTPKRGTLQSELKLSDIQSAYPWNGISDAVVDFFIRFVSTIICSLVTAYHNNLCAHIREMLPPNPDIACVGALTYTGIVKAASDMKRLVDIHRNVNQQMDLAGKKMIIFPCKLRYQRILILQLRQSNHFCSTQWHWIMVVVAPETAK